MTQRLVWAAAACVLLSWGSCTKEDTSPKWVLQTVKGVVMQGGRPVGANSMVTFTPVLPQDITVSGTTDALGNFELATSGRDGKRKPGAPEGSYSVMVTPQIEGQQIGTVQLTLPKTYKVNAGTNNFKLELPAKERAAR